jgi:hypothetical protein
MKFIVRTALFSCLVFAAFSPAADAIFYRHIPETCLGPEDPFCGGTNDPWRDTDETGESWCMDCYWSQGGGGFACGQVPMGYTGRETCDTDYYGEDIVGCTPRGAFCENMVINP